LPLNRIKKFLPRIISLVRRPSIRTPFYVVKEKTMAMFSEAFPLGGDYVESFKDGAAEDAGQKALTAAVEKLIAWKEDCPEEVQHAVGVLAHLIDGALAQKAECPKCKAEVPDGVAACPACGAELVPEADPDGKEGEGAVPPEGTGDAPPGTPPEGDGVDSALQSGLAQVKAALGKVAEAITQLETMASAGKSGDIEVVVDIDDIGAKGATMKLSEVMELVDAQVDSLLGSAKGGT
jgi:hypothetical protein